MSRQSLVLLVLGLVGGLFAARFIPAAHAATGWKCYVVDRLPDPTKAQDWRGAENVSEGLNKVSPNSPSGTLLTVQYPTAGGGWGGAQGDVGLICAKE